MKKIIGTFLLLISLSTYSQNKNILQEPKIDKRVELLSIVFRLADSQEYSSKRFPNYVESIEKHFDKYKQHDLIKYIKNDLRKHGISYDAVMDMAINITQPPDMKAISSFSKTIPDKRWGKKRAAIFLKLLNQFYVDADCETFFNQNTELYKIASKRFKKIYNNLDVEWYQKFYGQKPKGEYKIIIGLGNGGGNYGPQIILPDDNVTIYAIMGTWSVDSIGLPVYNMDSYFPILLHEFNHSFVNHVVDEYKKDLKPSGKIIFSKLKDIMYSQAYSNWKTMYDEAIVRASVIKYLIDHNVDTNKVKRALNAELESGFLWTDGLVAELKRYDNNREQYSTLKSFMPEIVSFFNKTASEIDTLMVKFNEKRPNVISISPFKNNATDVDYSITKISIDFDKPLKGRGYSINYGNKGKKTFPKFENIYYSKDKRTVYLEVKLEPNKEYQFVLTGLSFVSEEGIGINNYEVNFRTK